MPFDQAPIVEVFPPVWHGGQASVSWASTAPAGSYYQVYVGRKLAWWGRGTSAVVSAPSGGVERLDVGVVPAVERTADFSASLPTAPGRRVTLRWQGGTYQAADLEGFRIYGSPAADQAIDYEHPLAEIPAYTPGVYTDGYGLGGFGDGGFGAGAGSYSWRSGALSGGSWSFAVVSYDVHGNEGPPDVRTAEILAPPAPPARNTRGARLTYTYSVATHKATLNWLASPG